MRYLSAVTAAAAGIALMAGVSAASAQMSYEVTVTNNMEEELLAPILVAPVSVDGKIFVESYVSKEAEHQILTGDPGMLAAAIGDSAAVGHGDDALPASCSPLGSRSPSRFRVKRSKSVSWPWSRPPCTRTTM